MSAATPSTARPSTPDPASSRPRRLRARLAAVAGLGLAAGLLTPVVTDDAPAQAAPVGPGLAAARMSVDRCAAPALAPATRVPRRLPRVAGLGPAQVRRVAEVLQAGRTSRAQAVALTTYLAVTDPKASPERLGQTDLAVDAFYASLTEVPRWATLAPSVAAHRVTGSPDPYAYEDYWTRATVVMAAVTRTSTAELAARLSSGATAERVCRPRATAPRGFPLPAGSDWTVTPARAAGTKPGKPGKAPGSGDDPGATGVSAQGARPLTPVLVRSTCGTPVLAASSGVVRVRRDTRAAGPWLVEVERAGVTTTYAHVSRPTVKSGRPVVVGDPIAAVGDYGDVDGCALGFSVRTRAGGLLDAARSTDWLRPVPLKPAAPPTPPDTSRETTTFRMATYNVLGHHLTAPGGSRPGFAPGTERVARGIGALEGSGASIVTLQEFESPQAGVFESDGDWELFRATPNDRFRDGTTGGNAVAWRSDTWELLDSSEFVVPYRYPLHMPVVHLKHEVTGGEVYVVGIHNPATTAKQGNQSGARAVARAEEKRQVIALEESTDLPVIIAGDFNERGTASCDLSASGISIFGGCGGFGGVDLIFGRGDLVFSDLVPNRSFLGGISDHPLVTSGVTIHP